MTVDNDVDYYIVHHQRDQLLDSKVANFSKIAQM